MGFVKRNNSLRVAARKVFLAGLCLGTGYFCASRLAESRTINSFLDRMDASISKKVEKERADYSELTWEDAIEHVKTPEQAQDYLDRHFTFEDSRNLHSFKMDHEDQKANRYGYTFAAAALLSDNRFPLWCLQLWRGNIKSHCVFAYSTPDGFGALGLTPMEPKHESIEELVKAIGEENGWAFTDHTLGDLKKCYSPWIESPTELTKMSWEVYEWPERN